MSKFAKVGTGATALAMALSLFGGAPAHAKYDSAEPLKDGRRLHSLVVLLQIGCMVHAHALSKVEHFLINSIQLLMFRYF